MSVAASVFLLALGAVAGFLAGFFGIGGGLIVVPGLIFLFDRQGVDATVATQLAVGSSLASILATGSSSAASHHWHKNVQWKVALGMAPFLILGTAVGSSWAAALHGLTLRRLFGLFELLIGIRLALPSVPQGSPLRLPAVLIQGIGGFCVGILSALFGIGGGTVSVPVMVFFLAMSIKRAVGTSAALGVVAALFATAEYVYLGWHNPRLPARTIGFVDPIIAILIGASSVFFAPLGAWLTQILPPRKVSLAFSALLWAVGFKLIFS